MPQKSQSRRVLSPDGQTLVTIHDGYMGNFGIKHQRSLFLSLNGLELRGEDALSAPGRPSGAAPVPVVARFHVHPSVKASLSEDGRSVALTAPSGQVWHFAATGGQMALSGSVYCGDGEVIQRSEQILISASLSGERQAPLQWTLKQASI